MTLSCRPDHIHARPCGADPDGDLETCACGCRADDWFCSPEDYCAEHDLYECPYAHR